MIDPVFGKAKEALDILSADPEAQELARRRQEGEWTYRTGVKLAREEGRTEGLREGERKGLREGELRGLRETVRVACELLGIELDARRQRTIDELEPAELESLLTSLRRDRRWPAE